MQTLRRRKSTQTDTSGSTSTHTRQAPRQFGEGESRGGLEWSPNHKALEDKYGPITQNRIGVTAKTKMGNQGLRLILT